MKQSDLNDGIFCSLCFDLRSPQSQRIYFTQMCFTLYSLSNLDGLRNEILFKFLMKHIMAGQFLSIDCFRAVTRTTVIRRETFI